MRLAALRDRLEQGVLASIDDVLVTGDPQHRLPNTSNLAFAHADSEGILTLLDREGIACSSGSACKSGMQGPSHVLRSMRVPFQAAHGAVRFSLSRETTDADIDRLLAVLPSIITRLRAKAGRSRGPDRSRPSTCMRIDNEPADRTHAPPVLR